MEKFRRFCYEIFHDPFDPKSRITNGIVSFLIIVSLSVIPLEFLPLRYDGVAPRIDFIERLVVTIFLLEYVLRLWSAPKPMKFIFSWGGLIDLVAILPFFLERFDIIESVGIFLVLRLARVFKFINVFQREQSALMNVANRERYNQFRILEDEQIQRIVFKHPIVFLRNVTLPIALTAVSLFIFMSFFNSILGQILAIITFLAALLFFTKFWLDFNFDNLFITNYRVAVQDHHIFGATVNALRYESINNIVPDNRGLANFIFKIGRIDVQTASDLQNLLFRYAHKPHKVAQMIEENRQRFILAKQKENKKVDQA